MDKEESKKRTNLVREKIELGELICGKLMYKRERLEISILWVFMVWIQRSK